MDTNNSQNANQKYFPGTKTVILAGTSKLPENATAKHVFGSFTLEIEVEPVYFRIVSVSCTMCPSLGEKVLSKSLIGYEVERGLKNATEEINTRFFSATKRAVIAAIKDLYTRHIEYRNNINTSKNCGHPHL